MYISKKYSSQLNLNSRRIITMFIFCIYRKIYKFLSFYKQMPNWQKRILATPFNLIPRRYLLGRSYSLFSSEIKMLEGFTSARIKEYQLLKVKELLEYAVKSRSAGLKIQSGRRAKTKTARGELPLRQAIVPHWG